MATLKRQKADGSWEYIQTIGYDILSEVEGVKTLQVETEARVDAHLADYTQHPAVATTTNSGNNYSITLNPAPSSYVDGMGLILTINADSTDNATIDVNGLGATPIRKANGGNVNNLRINGVYTLRYSNSAFILQGEGASGNAVASDLLSGKTASTDAGDIVGTIPNRTGHVNAQSISGLGNTLRLRPPEGYFPGDTGNSVQATDDSWVGSNIKQGVSIFGKAGSLIEGDYSVGEIIPMTSLSDDVHVFPELIMTLGATPRRVWSPQESAVSYDANRNFYVYMTNDIMLEFTYSTGDIVKTLDFSGKYLGAIQAMGHSTTSQENRWLAVTTRDGTTNRFYYFDVITGDTYLLYTATNQDLAWSGIGVHVSGSFLYAVLGLQGVSVNRTSNFLHVTVRTGTGLTNPGTPTITTHTMTQMTRAEVETYGTQLMGFTIQQGTAVFGQNWTGGQYYSQHCHVRFDGVRAGVLTAGGSTSFFGSSNRIHTSYTSHSMLCVYAGYQYPSFNAFDYPMTGQAQNMLGTQYCTNAMYQEAYRVRPSLGNRRAVLSRYRDQMFVSTSSINANYSENIVNNTHVTPTVNCFSSNGGSGVIQSGGFNRIILRSVYARGTSLFRCLSYGRLILD